ncbi:PAS domain-containing protein [Candidatus Saganbacteria bacterium]|nr:PAS domain-containing protein [Candidatus Saganbacteria bacterium]
MSILFPYFELVASLFILLLCFQIFTRHYENKLARFFALFAFIGFLATILEYSSRIAFTLEFASGLHCLSTILWTFLFPLFANFSFLFAKKDKFLASPWSKVFLYLPAIILTILLGFPALLFQRYEIWSIGIVSQPTPLYWLFTLHGLFFGLLGIMTLFQIGFNAAQKTVRSQALLIAIGSILPLTIGVINDEILPLVLGQRITAPTAIFGLAIMNFFIFLAMRRYSLFAVSPSFAADVIIETMPDALLATDLEGRILFANEEAVRLFHGKCDKLIGYEFCQLFKDKKKYEQLYDEVVLRKKEILRFEADLVDPKGELLPSLINANLLRDKVIGDMLGIIFVVRDIRS